MEKVLDRRQRKTRQAIFEAFVELLSQKGFHQITVGEIIELADVGRATFYTHFETKDFLLKEFCEELFCHLFDAMSEKDAGHKHIFECEAPDSVFLHLFQHLQKNDNHILELFSCQNNDMFLKYFKDSLCELIINQQDFFKERKNEKLPEDFWIDHITVTFIETVRWWVKHGLKESPETITEYFYLSV